MSDEPGRLPEDLAVDPPPANGVREELARLGLAFSSLLSNRLELARLEYIEAHRQTAKQLILLILAAALLGAAFIAVNVLLIVWFWETPYRIDGLIWMVVGYSILGALVLWRLVVVRKRAARPFSATLTEFEKDRQWLAAGLSPKARSATSKKHA